LSATDDVTDKIIIVFFFRSSIGVLGHEFSASFPWNRQPCPGRVHFPLHIAARLWVFLFTWVATLAKNALRLRLSPVRALGGVIGP